ncbi:AAA family ATPase [Leuconostoc mesenteroides]|uniref:McrB family protein n=1 Tax=Leuconostoc mesenteroides TaxID=1245 RepID=UPI002114597C|nr:AAA family ATPase [Leuconostoc mesenteroides]UUE16987.1 AAA family ATPase [Leuconostoc mesenteroides]
MKKQINVDLFLSWFETNKDNELSRANVWKQDNDQLTASFKQDWPLSRIKNMTIDEYVIGHGSKSKSFCYEIEQGKYKNLHLSIQGGTARKFGIYWSRKSHSYIDKSGKILTEVEAATIFNQLRVELVNLIESVQNREYNILLDSKQKKLNSFVTRYALTTKIVCLYANHQDFTGINFQSNKALWLSFLKGTDSDISKNDSAYLINNKVTMILTQQVPELTNILLSFVLWDFIQNYAELENNEVRKSNNIMENGKMQKLHQVVTNSHNVILHGAPGTGKTFLAKSIAADIISGGKTTYFSELTEEEQEQLGFVQFHPSYDYTDFVEGLRPKTQTDGSMGFELKNGVFTNFIKKAQHNFELSQKSERDQVLENQSKNLLDTYLENVEIGEDVLETTRGSEFFFSDINEEQIELTIPKNDIANKVNLKISDLQDMIASKQSFKHGKDVTIFFKKYQRRRQEDSYYLAVFNDIIKKRKVSIPDSKEVDIKEKPYVFVIDEINRGEISKIFGELFYSIDPGYRGIAGSVLTQYANLHDDPTQKFFIPRNVYIIGTMNDIDRSVDSFDFAMRRRFRFVEVKANEHLEILDALSDDIKYEAIKKLTQLNHEISATNELNENYHIGPAYFLKLNDINFDSLWQDYLAPLLQEYIRGMYDEISIMLRFEKAYYQTSDQNDNADNQR